MTCSMFNTPMMESLAGGAGPLAKAPTGKNACAMWQATRLMNEYMAPCASTLTDIQYGDEGGFELRMNLSAR